VKIIDLGKDETVAKPKQEIDLMKMMHNEEK
jgi:hypothetical protein